MNLPFGFFCFLMIMCFAGGIYGIVENRKKTPGHPNIIPTICLLPMSVVALFYRYTNEFSTNDVLIKIADWCMVVFGIGFVISIFVGAFLAYKKGYMNAKQKKLVLMAIPWLILSAICVLLIIFIYYCC